MICLCKRKKGAGQVITAIARTAAFAAALSILVTACTHSMSTPSIPGTRELEARVTALEARKALLEDTNAIKRLQRAYGYYLDAACGIRPRTCLPQTPRSKSASTGCMSARSACANTSMRWAAGARASRRDS